MSRPARLRAALLALSAVALLSALRAAAAAGAATIAYPDLRVLVPPQDISIGRSGAGERLLEFTHITWDAGPGPLEIRPSYNALSGVSQGYQALYSSPRSGEVSLAELVPIVGPMVWEPPSDYRFPLDRFGLYSVGAGGGVGTLIAPSPKVDFCMTSDTYVGGVPETPAENEYPDSACSLPEGTLGISVGWGDQYDSTDGGEDINITSVANGVYWLRAEADPFHYFREATEADKITDTKLLIEGEKVTVLEQAHPDSTPPSVSLSTPAADAHVSGSVALSAAVGGASPITSVQFLLDGEPLGQPISSAPYTTTWNIGSTPPGTYYLSVEATAADGLTGTAADVPVTVPTRIGTLAITDQASGTGRSEAQTAPLSAEAGELLLAFAGSDGPLAGGQKLSISGGGLQWKMVRREDSQAGDAEIWSATATTALSGARITSEAAIGGYDEHLHVIVIAGAAGIGASGSAGAPEGAQKVTLTSTVSGSVFFATGDDWERDAPRTPLGGQTLVDQFLDTATGDTYWTQYREAAAGAAGEAVTLGDSAPTEDRWNMAAVEVLPAATSPPPQPQPPTVAIAAPSTGQTVSGNVEVSVSAVDNVTISEVQLYLDGKPLGTPITSAPYASRWETTVAANGEHTLYAIAKNVDGQEATSTPIHVDVENASGQGPCFVMDANVSVNGTGKVTTPTFTTAEGGEQLLALVSSDGPKAFHGQSVTVSGAGLIWHLVARANAQFGDAEIWWATAASALSGATVTSTPAVKGYGQSLSVVAMQMSNGIGTAITGSAVSGAPSVTLLTSEEGSLVFAVGHDWEAAIPRTLGPNQVLLHEYLDTRTGDTTWSQYTGQVTGLAGTAVTLNDIAPSEDRWNMAAVELRGDGPGL